MTVLDRAILQIDADVDDDGTDETGEFHFLGNAVVNEEVQEDYLIGGTGSNVNAVIDAVLDAAGVTQFGDGWNKGFFFNLGGGSHIFTIQFDSWEGAVDSNGTALPWGDTEESQGTIENGTGQDPLFQMQVFQNYIRRASADSIAPATLHIGEYTDGTPSAASGAGVFSNPLDVAIPGTNGIHAAEDYKSFSGTITCVEIFKLTNPLDAYNRESY